MTLIERLEQATGPDRELDWLIAEHLGEVPEHSIREIGFDYVWFRRASEFWLWKALDSEGRQVASWSPQPRTASLDAALALVEEKLPGWKRGLAEQDSGQWCASLWRPQPGGHPSALAFAEDAPTPALAVLIALLKALGDQHD